MKIERINESHSIIRPDPPGNPRDGDKLDTLRKILRAERDGWAFDYMVRIGRRDKYDYFFEDTGDSLVLMNGLLEIPPIREVLGLSESLTMPLLDDKIQKVFDSIDLPFEPYDYQKEAVFQALNRQKCLSVMCTGSGKSLTISVILEFFRRENMRGALIVPNINLLTQFTEDIKSYNLMEVHQGIQKAGGGNKARKLDPDKFLMITTWQSLRKLDSDALADLDFIICDEVHMFSSECTSQLVKDTTNAKFKLGFTGTLPKSKTSLMTLIGLFGLPQDIITSNQLISRSLGTPILVHSIRLEHNLETSKMVNNHFNYLDRVKILTKEPNRNNMISKLAIKLRSQSLGGTLILYTLIEHGLQIYKQITGENPQSLERSEQLGVYYMDGSVSSKDREAIRKNLEKDPKSILIANYSLLKMGVNIKSLRYAIFASPMKSFTTVAQSLGRGIRLSHGKELFEVYDLVDHFPGYPGSPNSVRTFVNSGNARKKIYQSQGFEYTERKVKL